jgi:hypothetical protein
MLFEVNTTAVFILLIIFLLLWIPCNIRLALAGVFPDDEKVRVTNLLSTFELKWTEIEKFEIKRWGPFPYVGQISLCSGKQKHALGIQERSNFPDGSGDEMIRDLNRELQERRVQAPEPLRT